MQIIDTTHQNRSYFDSESRKPWLPELGKVVGMERGWTMGMNLK
jgi:hypothetical protein